MSAVQSRWQNLWKWNWYETETCNYNQISVVPRI